MNNLKPRIPAWLFSAWAQVKKMEAMIQNGWQKYRFERTFLLTFQLKAMEVNVESPLFTVNHDLKENVEEDDVFNSTIPLMNVVDECLDANVEAQTSSFIHEATTKKRNNTSKNIDKKGKHKTLT